MENSPIIQNDEIDLAQLAKSIWAGRKMIYYSIGLFFLIGVIIAISSPIKYKASATLLPSSDKKGGSLGGLSSLAGLAGINLGALSESSGISPELYQKIVESYPFKLELIHKKFNFKNRTKAISLYEYCKADTIESTISIISKYTVKLPFTLFDKIFTPNRGSKNISNVTLDTLEIPVNVIDHNQARALGSVSRIVKITVEPKVGLVNVSVEMGEPILAAQVVAVVVDMLQRYVINYRTQQVRQKLVFVNQSFNEKRTDFEIAQRDFLDYKDQNRNVVFERINSEFQRRSDAYDLTSAVYKSLSQQLEQVKLQVKEETPAFSIIEPVQLPQAKSAPNELLIITICVIFGAFVGFMSILIFPFVPTLNNLYRKVLKV